jgi:hypothetical protein
MLSEDYSPALTSYFCLTPEIIIEALLHWNQKRVTTDISDYSKAMYPERGRDANC